MILRNIVFAALFLGVLALVFVMAWPFLTPIIFGGILAGSFLSVMRFATDRLKFSRNLSAILVCVLILLLVILPGLYIVAQLAGEVRQVYLYLKGSLDQEVITGFLFGDGSTARTAREIFGYIGVDYNYETIRTFILDTAQNVSLALLNQLNTLLSEMLVFSFQFVMMMLFTYSILLYGPDLKEYLFRLSPLPREDVQLLVDRFNQMNYVTLITNGLGGILQGVLGGLALWIAGLDSILLWTFIMIILAFIPIVGISFVYIPATIYLVAVGHYWTALFVFIWCSAVAFLTENWLKPLFVGGRVKISSILVLFSIIGGMGVFGPAGIFYGPLVVILFLTFVDIYHDRYAPRTG